MQIKKKMKRLIVKNVIKFILIWIKRKIKAKAEKKVFKG